MLFPHHRLIDPMWSPFPPKSYATPLILYTPSGTYTKHISLFEYAPGEWSIDISPQFFQHILLDSYHFRESAHTFTLAAPSAPPIKKSQPKRKKYKPVDQKVHSVPATMPKEFRIIRKFPSDPLEDLPILPTNPPEFVPGLRYTQERKDANDVDPNGFLWPEEVKLVHHIILMHQLVFAWDESE